MASTVDASASSETVNLFAATNKSGCSAQYWEYSTSDVGDNIKGGAVNEDKSPLKDAIDLRKDVHEWELEEDEAEAEAFEDIEDGESDLASDAILEGSSVVIKCRLGQQ